MSTRVCSPPNMDLTRDMLAQTCHNPPTTTTNTSLPSSTSHSASLRFFGPGTSIPTSTLTSDISHKSSRRNVARNLFGPPDPKSTLYARQKVIEMRDKDIQRWNFDFDKETPLEGRYQWEAISISSEPSGGKEVSGVHIPRPYALSRLPFLASSNPPSATSSDPKFTKELSDREPLLIAVLPDCSPGWTGSEGGGGESEGEESSHRLSRGHSLMSLKSTCSVTRTSSQESQSASSASSQYSSPSPSRSPPVQIDPTTIPIPSPPEDCSSSSSSTASYTVTSPCDLPVPVLDNECEGIVRIRKKPPKQTSLKDYMHTVRHQGPVKRRASSQTTGAPEKKAAM